MQLPSLLKLSPYLSPKIWAGNNLNYKYQGTLIGDSIGESYEMSDLKGESVSYNNIKFDELNINQKISLFGKPESDYLLKLLSTKDNLSIQVHPTNEFVKVNKNYKSKTECWLILSCEKGAGLYLGFNQEMSKEKFLKILNKELDPQKSLEQYLNFHQVSPGDFFFVPAGTIHAIGKGVTLAEVQESSGVTFRVWDWDRLDGKGRPRELHIKESLESINFDFDFNKNLNNYFIKSDFKNTKLLINYQNFNVKLLVIEKINPQEIVLKGEKACTLLVLEGKINIRRGSDKIFLDKFETCLVTHMGENEMTIEASSDSKVLYVF